LIAAATDYAKRFKIAENSSMYLTSTGKRGRSGEKQRK